VTPTLRVVRLTGELTVHSAAEQKASLLAAIHAADGIELDLSEVAELDTAGLQVLLLAKRESEQLGKVLRLLAPAQAVSDVLAIAHLNSDLEQIAASGPDHPLATRPGAR
jgi:anti-sigma B factor antagonist